MHTCIRTSLRGAFTFECARFRRKLRCIYVCIYVYIYANIYTHAAGHHFEERSRASVLTFGENKAQNALYICMSMCV